MLKKINLLFDYICKKYVQRRRKKDNTDIDTEKYWKILKYTNEILKILQLVLFEIAYWYRYFTSLHAVIQCIFQIPMKTLILSTHS